MMTHIFKRTIKILRPVILAAAVLLSAPVFVVFDQSFPGPPPAAAVTLEPALDTASGITIIYKNS